MQKYVSSWSDSEGEKDWKLQSRKFNKKVSHCRKSCKIFSSRNLYFILSRFRSKFEMSKINFKHTLLWQLGLWFYNGNNFHSFLIINVYKFYSKTKKTSLCRNMFLQNFRFETEWVEGNIMGLNLLYFTADGY